MLWSRIFCALKKCVNHTINQYVSTLNRQEKLRKRRFTTTKNARETHVRQANNNNNTNQ